jgi:hypothetical protein
MFWTTHIYKGVSKHKATQHEAEKFNLTWMYRIHRTGAADGTHQTSTLSPLKFKHLYHRGAGVRKESVSSVCRQEATAWFTSASVANRLPPRWFLGSKGMWINRRKVGIVILPVIVLRYDTLTVFYPGCTTTWTMCMRPFTWRNLRLRMLFHVGWADAFF